LPRVLPSSVGCRIDASTWSPPAVFAWLAKSSRCGVEELLRTFNCGIGMVLIVSSAHVSETLATLAANGEPAACAIGVVTARDDEAEAQVVVENTAGWFK
jgi:phosphoribosylaminoimidazole (AIR) synthetase